jgi:hypothetical protein
MQKDSRVERERDVDYWPVENGLDHLPVVLDFQGCSGDVTQNSHKQGLSAHGQMLGSWYVLDFSHSSGGFGSDIQIF